MKNGFQRMAIVGFAATLSACGYNINPYGASVQNVETIKALRISPVAVEKFTTFEPELSSIGCRAAGPVRTPNEQPFEKIIESALTDELKLAGAYDPKSPVIIQGHLEYITFNSNIGAGKWVIKVKVSSKAKPDGFSVDSQHEFSTNWVADKACQQVAQAFGPAVQDLINKIVSHPQFKLLAL
jgi:hypothetical protein